MIDYPTEAIFLAILKGDINNVRSIIEHLNEQGLSYEEILLEKFYQCNSTPLHIAAGRANIDILNYIITLLRNKNLLERALQALDETNCTPLHYVGGLQSWCAKPTDEEKSLAAKILIQAGATIRAVESRLSRTPIDFARANGYVKTANLMQGYLDNPSLLQAINNQNHISSAMATANVPTISYPNLSFVNKLSEPNVILGIAFLSALTGVIKGTDSAEFKAAFYLGFCLTLVAYLLLKIESITTPMASALETLDETLRQSKPLVASGLRTTATTIRKIGLFFDRSIIHHNVSGAPQIHAQVNAPVQARANICNIM
jgi:hypothetical protein